MSESKNKDELRSEAEKRVDERPKGAKKMARNFLVTKNIDDMIDGELYLKEIYEKTGARYVCGQIEKVNHLHVQFFINFKTPQRPSRITKIDSHLHIEYVNVNNGADTYCLKKESRVEGPWEFGERPVKVNNKVDWEMVWNKAKEGKFEEIPASVRVIHYSKLKLINKDYLQFKDAENVRGIWIWGKSGSGKSRYVRDFALKNNKRLYPKLCNKWWDGYKGEEIVCMDDLMPVHNCLCQHLKIWTDRYGCVLETKGGAITDNYKYFFVTSQYELKTIFPDPEDQSALERRFKIFNIKDLIGLNIELKF